jgi:hypothetical protein
MRHDLLVAAQEDQSEVDVAALAVMASMAGIAGVDETLKGAVVEAVPSQIVEPWALTTQACNC